MKEKLAKYQLVKPILIFSLGLGSAIGCAASVAFIFVTLRVIELKFFDSKLNFEVSKISNCYFRSVIRNESKSWFLVSRWIKLKVHI